MAIQGSPVSEHGSSSGSSDITLVAAEETYTSSLFQTEPLYQFYDNDVKPATKTAVVNDVIKAVENMYEFVNHSQADVQNNNDLPPNPPPTRRRREGAQKTRLSAMDLTTVGGRRSLWTELPEVVNSGVLSTIDSDRKRLQEAMFEVVSSEASYLKSLNILIRHFVQSPKLTSVVSKRDSRVLFSDVIAVSSSFLDMRE